MWLIDEPLVPVEAAQLDLRSTRGNVRDEGEQFGHGKH